MTKLSDYDRGVVDVLSEIFTAAKEGKDIHEKIGNLLERTVTILQRINNIHVKGVAKK